MATSFSALAAALRDSLRRGRLQREQDTLDTEYVSHEELLASGQCSAGAANEPLNRYCNLFPLDAHRVVLQGKPQGGASSDFVNASHVVLPSLPPDEAARGPFIVAQGPMHPDWHGPDTLPAFWRMVSEQDVGTVVSMSRTGRGFTGFAPWWPQGGAGSEANPNPNPNPNPKPNPNPGRSPSPSPNRKPSRNRNPTVTLTLTLP